MEEPWRLIFLINVPIGVLALVFVRRRLPESKKAPFQKLDLLGMLLIVTFLVCAIFPLIVGPENQWPYWCFGSLAFSIVIFIFFLRKQQTQHLTGAAGLIDLKLLKNRGYQIGLGAAIAYYMVQDAYFIIHSLYLQNELHFTSSYTGLAFFFQGLGYVVASLYASKRVVYKGKMVVCVGIGIMVVALLSHLFLFSQSSISNLGLFVVLFIYGIGCGTVLPSLMTLALKDIPPQEVGVASGIYLTIQQLAICLGIALLVGIYLHQANAPVDLIKTISGAYVYSNILSVVLLLLVAVLTMNMPPFAANHAYTKNNKSIHAIKSTKKVD